MARMMLISIALLTADRCIARVATLSETVNERVFICHLPTFASATASSGPAPPADSVNPSINGKRLFRSCPLPTVAARSAVIQSATAPGRPGRGAVAHRRIKPQNSAALERQTGAKDVDTRWARMRRAPPRGTAERERSDFSGLDRTGNGGRLGPERDTAGLRNPR